MKVRICPLCDQPMKKAHRCDSCNSFIWKPQYLDIHYNTGTMYGEDCSYDTKAHDYDYQDNGSVTMMPSEDDGKSLKRKFRGVKEIEFPENDTFRGSQQAQPTDKKKKKGGIAKKLALIFFILSILSTAVEVISAFVFDFADSVYTAVPEPELSIESEEAIEVWPEDWYDSDSERVDLTVDEVLAGGKECTGSDHMDVTVETFTAVIEPLLADLSGVESIGYSDSTDNYAYNYEYQAFDDYTYFNSYRMYDMDYEIGYYYDLSWDTYSGRLHEVAYDVYGSDMAEEYYVATMEALCGGGEQYRVEFQKQRTIAEDEGYVFFETEGYEVYISYYDGTDGYETSYYISIVKAM